MRTSIHTYTNAYVHTHIHIDTYTYAYTYTFPYTFPYTCPYKSASTYRYIFRAEHRVVLGPQAVILLGNKVSAPSFYVLPKSRVLEVCCRVCSPPRKAKLAVELKTKRPRCWNLQRQHGDGRDTATQPRTNRKTRRTRLSMSRPLRGHIGYTPVELRPGKYTHVIGSYISMHCGTGK